MGQYICGPLRRSYTKTARFIDGPFGRGYYSIVYAAFAKDVALTKFGRTLDIEKRFAALQSMSPSPVELVGYLWLPIDAETRIHAHLADHRHHGEWFSDHHDVRKMSELIKGKKARVIVDLVGVISVPSYCVPGGPDFYLRQHN